MSSAAIFRLPILWANQQMMNWWHFSYFPRKRNLTFHWKQFARNVKICFLGKIRKIFQNAVSWKFYPECYAFRVKVAVNTYPTNSLGDSGGGGGVTSYIWHSTDVRAEWPPFSVLPNIWLTTFFFRQKCMIDSIFFWIGIWKAHFSDVAQYIVLLVLSEQGMILFAYWTINKFVCPKL